MLETYDGGDQACRDGEGGTTPTEAPHGVEYSSSARTLQVGTGGRVLYLCFLVMFFLGARATEMLKDEYGAVHPHPVHCLTRADVAFFTGADN